MSQVTPFPDLDRARTEAAEWIARAFQGLSAEQSVALRGWSRRPENRRAMQEMSGVWQGLDVLSVLADLFPREGMTDGPGNAGANAPAREPATAQIRSGSRWRLATAASVLLAVAVGAVLFVRRHEAPASARAHDTAPHPQVYSSTVGEHRSIRLDDGSTLALNSDTQVDVSYTRGLRSLNLHRGEAHFEVAHDAARPFVVTTNGRTVRAVGTAFNVRRRNAGELDVLVTEGIVSTYVARGGEIALANDPPNAMHVSAGHLLHVRGDGVQIVRPGAGEIDALTAWRRGVLVLDGTTLEAALDEAGRYTTKRIVIDDASLRTLRLGGSFRTDDLGPLFRALRANFGIETHEDADGTLRLTRATPRE